MKKDVVLVTFMMAVSSLAGITEAGTTRGKPNDVLILADDMGDGDCGVHNALSKIRTPMR